MSAAAIKKRAERMRAAQAKVRWHRKSCAALVCREEVTRGRIFCRRHWFFLPASLRVEIVATFRAENWDAHQAAVCRASDLIEQAHRDARDSGFDGVAFIRAESGDFQPIAWRVM